MQIQEVAKGRDWSGNKTKITTASDVWMSILIITIFSVLIHVFWKRGQRRPTLLCSMARVRMPLKTLQWIGRCVIRGLQRLHPESLFSMHHTVMHCRRCVPEGTCYIGPNSQNSWSGPITFATWAIKFVQFPAPLPVSSPFNYYIMFRFTPCSIIYRYIIY